MMRSHKSFISIVAIIALSACGAVYAELQFDIRSGLLFGFPDTARYQKQVRPAVDLDGTLYGNFDLGKGLNLSFEDHLSTLNGIGNPEIDSTVSGVSAETEKLPATELNVPFHNLGGIDLSFHGLRIGYRNQHYGKTRGLEPVYIADYFGVIDSTYTYSFQYKRKMRQRYEGQYRFENELFIAEAGLYHISTAAAIDTINLSEYQNSLPITASATCLDLTGGVRIPMARMRFLGGGRAMIDHYGPPSFNSMDLYALIGGDAALDFHRLEYRVRSDYFTQEYLEDTLRSAHATTGFFQTLHLRGTLWIGQSFMIKGLSAATFARNLLKQRYGLSLRKPWENGSFVEAGASSVMGGLFPMVDYFIQWRICPVEPLGLSLRLKSVWDWPRGYDGDFSKTLFVKAVWDGEASYRFGTAAELYLNGIYTDFNSRYYSEFPSRLFMGGGVRLYVP